MKQLVVIVVMAMAVTAYKKGRKNGALPTLEDFPPYQGTRQHLPFHEPHQPFREQSFKAQQHQSYRNRPYRQDLSSYGEQLSFRDHSLLRDYSSPKNRPFYGDSSFFRDASDFKGPSSTIPDGTSFKDQPSIDQATLKSDQILRDQTLTDRYSYQQQSFRDDYRFADLYDKPIGGYKGELSGQQPGSFVRDPDYLKHGNHGLGYASLPSISSYENAFPLNKETSTTMAPPMAPTPTQEPLQQSTVSSTASAITQVHTSATSEVKMASQKASHTVTMASVKSDTLADVTSSTSTPAVSANPNSEVTMKQSSKLADPQTASTTEASLPVMATELPIISFGRHSLPPIEFQTAKFTAPSSYYASNDLKDKLQQSLLNYLISQQAKNAIKANEQISLPNYTLSDVLNNSLDNKIHGTLSNYILPEESKGILKDNVQSSLLNYLLQQESNRGLSFQQSSLTEATNYIPLTGLTEKPKLTLPTIPLQTLPTITRPLQTVNYAHTTLPRVSAFATQGSAIPPLLSLGTGLTASLSTSGADSQVANVFNSLPDGISGGIPVGIAGNVSPSVPTGIPTLNLGQNFQHVGQTRQFGPARSQPYSTGLQLQLGGFGGIDYTLRSANPAPRPFELGIAKVGLSLPELPRQQLSTFSKVGLGHRFW